MAPKKRWKQLLGLFEERKGTEKKERQETNILMRAAICLVGALVMGFALGELPAESAQEHIHEWLQSVGIDTIGVEFTLVENGGSFYPDIYESSKPLDYYGHQVNQWAYRTTVDSSRLFQPYTVKPHPAVPEPITLRAQVVVSDQDYQRIQARITGESMDQYIARLIREDLEQENT